MSKHIFLGNDRIVTKQIALGTGENYDNADTAVEKLYTYYYHADHLGSTSVVTDHNGEVYERLEYTPYGETWLDETSGNTYFDTPYRFSAKEKDEETGLYYYGARYLDPKYSRWISADPALGEYLPQAPINDEAKKHNRSLPGQGGVFNVINLNLYHYAGNNPIKYTDPSGMMEEPYDSASKVESKAEVVTSAVSAAVKNDFSKSFTNGKTTFADPSGITEGVEAYIPRPTLETAGLKSLSSKLAKVSKGLMFISGGIALADAIQTGVVSGDFEKGAKRLVRNGTVIAASVLAAAGTELAITTVTGGTGSIAGAIVSTSVGIYAGNKVDSIFEKKGW